MQIHQIRNATMKITYAGKVILTDPYLADKFSLPSYTGKSPNPLTDLPFPAERVIEGVDTVLLTHIHSDHFDPKARELLPKEIQVMCQACDEIEIADEGFRNIVSVDKTIKWEGITFTRTPSQHGTGNVLKEMGETAGYVFQAQNEPTVYWAGDTIWCDAVAGVVEMFKPDVIITHSCGAVWGNNVPIIMNAEQTIAVCQFAIASIVVATHMDALDHATVTRAELRAFAENHGVSADRLRIPKDGEILNF